MNFWVIILLVIKIDDVTKMTSKHMYWITMMFVLNFTSEFKRNVLLPFLKNFPGCNQWLCAKYIGVILTLSCENKRVALEDSWYSFMPYMLVEETSLHILWLCPAALDVWGKELTFVQKWPIDFWDCWELWTHLIHQLTYPQLDDCAIVLQNLW